ncbi:hypothetical protein OGZ37_09540 [Lactococcus lactis]|uniref:hypothetical protein n=1 Tax=Lactococcus lactis TaxID=1358 RepID=UPI0024184959|nr:hypothetical protein [Lactococcus lactis]MDG4966813.1 hypothetical protein [Lactococcus lactis]
MSLVLRREQIVSFLKEKIVYDGTEKIIWANIGSAKGPHAVIVFNDIGILTLPITPLGKIQGEIIIIPKEAIKSVTFKKGLLSYKMSVNTRDSEVPNFRISKIMIGYSEQKTELDTLLKIYK